MLFNFHSPNKVYVKEFPSNKHEIHQSDDERSGSWLGLRGDIYLLYKRLVKPEIPLPLREQTSRHTDNRSLYPLHHQGGRSPECFDFQRSVRGSDFTGGFVNGQIQAHLETAILA